MPQAEGLPQGLVEEKAEEGPDLGASNMPPAPLAGVERHRIDRDGDPDRSMSELESDFKRLVGKRTGGRQILSD